LLIREHPSVDAKATVEVKSVRSDVMKKAFGVQTPGQIVVRFLWTWSPSGDATPGS
jgi:hypothetical protein